MRTVIIFLVGCLLVVVAGCQTPSAEEIRVLKRDKKQLQNQLDKSESEIEQFKKQAQVLSGLKPQVRLENLYNLQKIKLTRYTGLYDKNKDGKKDQLIVYLQPIDQENDIVKASGAVDVELWDLNKKDGQALLGQWHVEPGELKKLWSATILIINYRLPFDLPDKIEGLKDPLTVKVTFTDYLTGKVFQEQKIIKLD